jgi:hypothetical protein
MTIILVVLAWFGFGLLGAGGIFAEDLYDSKHRWKDIYEREDAIFSWRGDLSFALVSAFFGPIWFLVSLAMTGFWRRGWRLWP